MKEFGVQLRQGKRRQLLSNEQLDQLVRMRFGGHMWKAIARHFDKSETYITEQFKKRTAYMTELQEVAIAIHEKHMNRWPLTHEQAVTLAKEQLPKDETTTIIYHLATELHSLNDVHPSA
jgi:YesN/AraC family two-component response regulator